MIDGPGRITDGQRGQYMARLRGTRSGGRHVLVDEAWAAFSERLAARGAAVPSPVAPTALRTALTSLGATSRRYPSSPHSCRSSRTASLPHPPRTSPHGSRADYDLDLLILAYRTDPGTAGRPADDPTRSPPGETGEALADLVAAGFHSVRVLPDPAWPGRARAGSGRRAPRAAPIARGCRRRRCTAGTRSSLYSRPGGAEVLGVACWRPPREPVSTSCGATGGCILFAGVRRLRASRWGRPVRGADRAARRRGARPRAVRLPHEPARAAVPARHRDQHLRHPS